MKTNLKHLTKEFLNEEELKDEDKLNDWLSNAQISSNSKFSDSIWNLDGCDLYGKSLKIIDWEKQTQKENLLMDFSLGEELVKNSFSLIQEEKNKLEKATFTNSFLNKWN